MTVIVAIRCRDGAVIGSDSQATEMVAGVRFDVQKLFKLTDRCVWGGTGLVSVIDEIRTTLEAGAATIDAAPRPEQQFKALIYPVLQRNYVQFLQPPNAPLQSPAVDTIASGVDANGMSFIIEIDRNCNASLVSRDWHAVGSGAGFATMAGALLEHFGLRDQPVEYGTLVLFRAIDAVISTSGFGVGGEPQIWQINANNARQLDGNELGVLSERLAAWKEIERDSLQQVMGEAPADEAPLPPEVPTA